MKFRQIVMVRTKIDGNAFMRFAVSARPFPAPCHKLWTSNGPNEAQQHWDYFKHNYDMQLIMDIFQISFIYLRKFFRANFLNILLTIFTKIIDWRRWFRQKNVCVEKREYFCRNHKQNCYLSNVKKRNCHIRVINVHSSGWFNLRKKTVQVDKINLMHFSLEWFFNFTRLHLNNWVCCKTWINTYLLLDDL